MPSILQHSQIAGSLLLATPSMADPRFERAVILMCTHNQEGSMGIVINRAADHITFPNLMGQLGIKDHENHSVILPLRLGGPVETQRGFVIHDSGYKCRETIQVDKQIYVSATIDILQAVAKSEGPAEAVLALGYAGWGAGQLENELQTNSWLTLPAEKDIIFKTPLDQIWQSCLQNINVDPAMLSSFSGHA